MINGLKIKSLREAAGLTGTQLGEAIGVSQSMITHYEMGRKLPSMVTLCRLADKFGVTLDELRLKEKEGA